MQTELSLNFPATHPVFAGHFPGHPMVPGALLLDAVLHAIAQAQTEAGSADASPQPPEAPARSVAHDLHDLPCLPRQPAAPDACSQPGRVQFDRAGVQVNRHEREDPQE